MSSHVAKGENAKDIDRKEREIGLDKISWTSNSNQRIQGVFANVRPKLLVPKPPLWQRVRDGGGYGSY